MTGWAARRFVPALGLLILAAILAYLFAWAPEIAARGFADPDDQMRLQQVRDWLAGQAWRDVSQHRMNAPWGAPMHWSRLVDLPIAGVILLLRPLLGPAGAELGAALAVPAVTLAVAMALVAALGRRLAGPVEGLVAAALLPLTSGAIQQLRPLRIDHHGWQMVLALGIVLGVLDRRGTRGGRIAGVLAALWLAISLEGLPFCAAAGALLAVRRVIDPARDGGRFAGYAGMLALVSTLVFALTRPAAAWGETVCDAIAPVHMMMLGLVALAAWGATRAGERRIVALALLGGAGAACVGIYAGLAPVCTRGAFAALDPLVTRFWYLNVQEGLPVWRLPLSVALGAVGYPLVALAGLGVTLRRAADRAAWIDYALLLLAATLVAAAVQRAGGVANLLALPAGAALMRAAFARIERLPAGLVRVIGGAALPILLLPPMPGIAGLLIGRTQGERAVADAPAKCGTRADFAALDRLPPSALMTSIDIGPAVLIETRHSVVASSHHRNVRGIHDALATFLGPPEAARRRMAARGIAYLVVCADQNELAIYRKARPHGFWGQLAAGRRFDWAVPVPLPGSHLSVWRIRR